MTYAPEAMLERCYGLAQLSPDPRTQIGALVLKDGVTIGKGWNTLPGGVMHIEARWERPDKYAYVEHAERNAIYDAALRGNSTLGATMYATSAACADCARAIIQSGIDTLVTHSHAGQFDTAWRGSVELGDEMMREAGVRILRIPFEVGTTIRFNGQVIGV